MWHLSKGILVVGESYVHGLVSGERVKYNENSNSEGIVTELM